MTITHALPAGSQLSVVAPVGCTGTVRRLDASGGSTVYAASVIDESTTSLFGQYPTERHYEVITSGAPSVVTITVPDATAGFNLGQSATDKVGLFGVTPVVQPSAAAQAAIGARTYVAPGAVPADSAEVTAPTTVEFNAALAALASTRTALVALAADVATHKTLVNALRTAGVNLGTITGS